jgi:hypothetical protein
MRLRINAWHLLKKNVTTQKKTKMLQAVPTNTNPIKRNPLSTQFHGSQGTHYHQLGGQAGQVQGTEDQEH